MKRSSIMASTSAVVPTLRYVDTSARLASPMITCRRRYFSGSACGSSRVLMIGRLSVVSSPTSTSKKSARWLSWNPCSRPSWPIPTRPAPQMTCRLTKNGVRWRTMSTNGVDRRIR